MLKLENIIILNGIVSCNVIGEGCNMTISVPVYNWDDLKCSDESNILYACHARNKLYRLYIENNGKLPSSTAVIWG